MKDSIQGTVIGGVILAVLGYTWATQSGRVRRWCNARMAEADDDAEAELDQVASLLDQVADRAKKLGIPVTVTANSGRVTYAGGHATLVIPDRGTYLRAMESRRVDILNTVNASPPTPLSQRDRAWLERWPSEHLESDGRRPAAGERRWGRPEPAPSGPTSTGLGPMLRVPPDPEAGLDGPAGVPFY